VLVGDLGATSITWASLALLVVAAIAAALRPAGTES
jgi:hypothetical protein